MRISDWSSDVCSSDLGCYTRPQSREERFSLQTENPPAFRRFEFAASTFLPCGVSAHLAPCLTTSPSVTSSSRIGSVGSWGRRFDRPSSVERCGWLRCASFCFSVMLLSCELGSAPVCTPVPNAHLLRRLLLHKQR